MTVPSPAANDAVLAQVDAGLDQARERLFDRTRHDDLGCAKD